MIRKNLGIVVLFSTIFFQGANSSENEIYKKMEKPAFIFDGRNILNRDEMEKIGFVYKGIGL